MSDKATVVLNAIYARKSVRHFTGEPVTKACLLALMKAGIAAPSARNRQPIVLKAMRTSAVRRPTRPPPRSRRW